MLHYSNIAAKKNILLVEDNLGDARLIQEAIRETGNDVLLTIVTDGTQAMDFLNKANQYASAPTPDLILLDLNIPKINGRQVLFEVKNNPALKRIPVLILTISQADDDVQYCYTNYANAYIAKPFTLDEFIRLFESIMHFWFGVAKLPPKRSK